MRKIAAVVTATAAVAMLVSAVGTADAWRIPYHHKVHAAALPPIGPCKADPDHIGGSTCEISTYAVADGVHVTLANDNGYPVKISTVYADIDHQADKTTVTTRVPAHEQRQLVIAWGGASTLWVQWIDESNRQNLGSQILDRP